MRSGADMLALNPGSAWPALSLQASERRPARSRVVAAAAPAVEALRAKSLQLEQFDAAAVAAAGEGARALLGEGVACDRTTLEWFARDRKLDVEKTAVKVLAYAQWRQAGFTGLTEADVAREAATGKAVLLADRDVVCVSARRASAPRLPRGTAARQTCGARASGAEQGGRARHCGAPAASRAFCP